jgi:hypothetical protein
VDPAGRLPVFAVPGGTLIITVDDDGAVFVAFQSTTDEVGVLAFNVDVIGAGVGIIEPLVFAGAGGTTVGSLLGIGPAIISISVSGLSLPSFSILSQAEPLVFEYDFGLF